MARPAILAVDDDWQVLNAVERDLRSRYAKDYRILKASSGNEALETCRELLRRNDTVALFVVDQRMPEMNGIEFLEQAAIIFPEAKKALLTAYADTQAAINAINRIGLDYYLLKPWDPPEERLYPILDDMLDNWKANVRLPYDGIRVVGSMWSPASHEARDFLARHQIPFQWLDIERDSKAKTMVEEYNQGELKLPTIFFPDGSALVQPTMRELADKAGLQTRASLPFYDLVILGAGPAGLAASVVASSEGLRCLVIERQAPGGQAGRSPNIENYLGFPAGIAGDDLMRRAATQTKRFGTEIVSAQDAVKVRLQDGYKVVTLSDGSEVSARALLVATGASFNILKMPGAAQLSGAGVYYGAAHTEALYYKGQDVCVIGGANSAAQAALYLGRFCSKVTVIVRGPLPQAAKYLTDAMVADSKLEVRVNRDLVEVRGKEKLEAVVVKDTVSGEIETIPCAALFVFIGVKPQSNLVADLVLLDERGEVLTGLDLMKDGQRPAGWPLDRDPFILETSVPGIFAAGDVRHGTSHRVASATGEGGIAVAMIREYLKTP